MMFTIIGFYSLQDGENAELPNSHRMCCFFHQGANSGLLLSSEGGDHVFMSMLATSLSIGLVVEKEKPSQPSQSSAI